MNLFISITIFGVNELIEYIFVKLVNRVTRHGYKTTMNREVTIYIFILMYLNTGILIALADMRSPIFSSVLSRYNTYRDTAKGWFLDTNNAIVFFMVINLIGFCLVNFSKACLKKCLVSCCRKKYMKRKNFAALYQGQCLNMPLSYARTLTMLFVAFTFSGAFPLLIYILAIYCIWQYWMEKYMFLRHYRVNGRIGEEMHRKVMGTLPALLVIHWVTSWWFYGSPGILDN